MKYLKLLLSLVFISVQFLVSAQNQGQKTKSDSKDALQKLSTIYYLIDNFYVDTANVEKLTEEAIITILKELDPHSAYISKKMSKKPMNLWKAVLKVLALLSRYFRIPFW